MCCHKEGNHRRRISSLQKPGDGFVSVSIPACAYDQLHLSPVMLAQSPSHRPAFPVTHTELSQPCCENMPITSANARRAWRMPALGLRIKSSFFIARKSPYTSFPSMQDNTPDQTGRQTRVQAARPGGNACHVRQMFSHSQRFTGARSPAAAHASTSTLFFMQCIICAP